MDIIAYAGIALFVIDLMHWHWQAATSRDRNGDETDEYFFSSRRGFTCTPTKWQQDDAELHFKVG
jgi:hypothetical protein